MIVIWSPTSEATWPVQKRRKVTLVRSSAGAATTGQPSSRGWPANMNMTGRPPSGRRSGS
jgi:hypothetical protein